MKKLSLKSVMTIVFGASLALSPLLVGHADARRGGGGGMRGGGGAAMRGRGAGGFSGGSFRGGGGYAHGPRGGAAARGPRGGAVAQGPRGGTAARGPRGGTAARGPRGGEAVRGPRGYGAARGPAGGVAGRGPYHGNVNINRNVTVNRGWDSWGGYYRPGAVAAGVAAGAVVASLPYAAQPVVVNNQSYYESNGTYYQRCYQGSEVQYCAVENPRP